MDRNNSTKNNVEIMRNVNTKYLSEKDDGTLEGGGEVEGRVGVALAGRALAEVADDHQAVLGALERVCRAGSYKI